jgi:hypothetical protein
MATTGLMLTLSALVILTIPADLPGTPLEGAQMIVGLQGMAFIGVALIRGAWFCWKERATIRSMIRDLRDLGNA